MNRSVDPKVAQEPASSWPWRHGTNRPAEWSSTHHLPPHWVAAVRACPGSPRPSCLRGLREGLGAPQALGDVNAGSPA